MCCSEPAVGDHNEVDRLKGLGNPFLELIATQIIERVEKSIENMEVLAKSFEGNAETYRKREMEDVYSAIAEGVAAGFRVAVSVTKLEREIQCGG